MYKIFYGFRTVECRLSYDTSPLCSCDTPSECLTNWSKYTTEFVLDNLEYLEIMELQYSEYGHPNGKFLTIKNKPTLDMINEFISERRK